LSRGGGEKARGVWSRRGAGASHETLGTPTPANACLSGGMKNRCGAGQLARFSVLSLGAPLPQTNAVKGRTMRRQLTIVAPSWPTTWTARAWCWLAGLAVLTLLAGPVAAEPSRTTSCPVIDTFQSAGKPITVERFEPEAAGKYPAFLLLHAVDGMAKP